MTDSVMMDCAARRPPQRPSRRHWLGRASAGMAAATLAGYELIGYGLTGAHAQTASRPSRTALLIGNARYPNATLSNPVRDARLIGNALLDLRFQVARLEDADRQTMIDALRRWIIQAEDAEVRLFYFAGHGVQYQGKSYLIPVDSEPLSDHDLTRRAFDLAEIVEPLSLMRSGVNFVIMDACRADPAVLLSRSGARSRNLGSGRADKGLARMTAPRGTVIAYSTAPGALAADGAGARNSVFSRHLALQLRQPGLPVEAMFKRVRIAVMRETGNVQVPWESSSLVGDFCLQPDPTGRCQP